jgi:hypothetical protein
MVCLCGNKRQNPRCSAHEDLQKQSLCLRVLPWRAVVAPQQVVGRRVADNLFLFSIPFNAAPEFERKHAQKAHVGSTVTNFNIADWAVVGANALDEIGPQQAEYFSPTRREEYHSEVGDVLIVRFIQVRREMDIGLAVGIRIERRAMRPAHMERAVIAVKVASEVLF